MDWFRHINRYLVFPLYYWKNGDKRLERLEELEINQFLSVDAMEKLQLSRLQRIIKIAFNETDYYRQIMSERKITPDDIQTLQDVQQLPILTKKDIQDNLDAMISKKYTKSELFKDMSGGSTGTPTVYYKNIERHNLRRADQIRHDRWSGWDIGKRKALIWGAQRDLKAVQSFREHIIARYIERTWELDAFEMSPDKMLQFTGQLEKIKPSMVLGYANALVAYAEYLNEHNANHKIRLDGIISSAESLTEEKRAIIEKAFRCKVLNRYGSREVGLIASECKHQEGLHINADNILLEITNGEKQVANGQLGEIAVTDYWNFGMPLIRYQLGDMGIKSDSKCSCGRSLPLLASVEGRVSDFFVAQNGTKVHGEYFTHLFYDIPEVKQFQMIQETLEEVTVNIVPTQINDKLDSVVKMVEEKTKEMLGKETKLTFKYLESIPSTSSGKFLFTISKVS
ncbi:phenylacetate--CoA ligase family protein [Aliikangiella coralliicola]|uniref:Phenylacetate--CoA ligase family protein n=1 Tax=Aliikangiella coralliicola TaxID=2592383 RepID=A0A545UHF3_9GAMM|nr:phenylacetate--CoA ligase family protein [Aliikangiella coralliicola]TQV88890.1 phenylacetate--CoA ligase family protein [Aliikangiella coralliicola]